MAQPDWQSSNAGSELHNPTSWNWMEPLSLWVTAVPGTAASKDGILPIRGVLKEPRRALKGTYRQVHQTFRTFFFF